MPFDTKIIDEHIRKMEELKKFASDPLMRSMLESMFVNGPAATNGAAAKAKKPESQLFPHMEETHEDEVEVPKSGTLIGTVLECVNSTEGLVDVNSIYDKMVEQDFRFNNSNPKVAIGTNLRNLARRKLLKLAKTGSGSTPNKYRRLEENSTER